MKRIRLVVTGDLERAAAVPALSRRFPASTDSGEEVVWLRPRKVNGATTHRLRRGAPPNSSMKLLAQAVLAEAWEGADGTPADLVIAADDLELHNFDQADIVCEHFRAALEEAIGRRNLGSAREAQLRARVRERCSFHLLAPMVEAYLFIEQAALVRAGCAPQTQPRLRSPDVEGFEVTDPAWLPTCAEVNGRMQGPLHQPWWREERHAKHYLEYLVTQSGGFYDETVGGAAAFGDLGWEDVPGAPFVRALFEDIGDFFGVAGLLGPGLPSPLTYPARSVHRATLLLRNL